MVVADTAGEMDGPVEGQEPTEDELFEVLANRRRRYALHALSRDPHGRTELGPLAEQVAAWENETTVSEVTGAERKRVYTALQQNHLPKMDDVGLLTFDKRSGSIEASEHVEDADIYMDVVRGRDIPWSEYYLGLSGVSGALVAAVWMDAFPFSVLPEMAWGAFIVTVFTISSAAHLYYTRQMKLGSGEPPELEQR